MVNLAAQRVTGGGSRCISGETPAGRQEWNPLLYCSTLAHEFRHVWQHEHDMYVKDENCFGSGVDLSPKEIDADAFSIAYLCKYENTSWDDACEATIDYHTTTDKGQAARIEMAKEIYISF